MRGLRADVVVNVKASSMAFSQLSSEMTMDIFRVKIQCLKGGGVHHRVIESHLSSGCHLLGRTHFNYLCKHVSELKRDLMPMKVSSPVYYFFGKGRDPASQSKGYKQTYLEHTRGHYHLPWVSSTLSKKATASGSHKPTTPISCRQLFICVSYTRDSQTSALRGFNLA